MTSPVGMSKQKACENNIKKDFASGVLTKENGIEVFGVDLTKDRYVYHSTETKGKELTLGQLKERYCIDTPGALRGMNNFSIGTIEDGGANLDNYPASYTNNGIVNIPPKIINSRLNIKG